jgi:hypothetical protein
MFTWICPQCGREVAPSEPECPFCKDAAAVAPQAVSSRPSAEAAAPARRWPAWLLTALFALGFAGIGLAAYWAYRSARAPAAPPAQAPGPVTAFQTPAAPETGVKAHPLARHIEITGLRLSEDARQRAGIQFLVVNHSGAELEGLGADVQLIAVTPKGEREAVGTFSFRLSRLGPYESRELKVPLQTRLRVYELPDWQFLRAEFQITSPTP